MAATTTTSGGTWNKTTTGTEGGYEAERNEKGMNRKELVVGTLYKIMYREKPHMYVGEMKEKSVTWQRGTPVTNKILVFAAPVDWRPPLDEWVWEPYKMAKAYGVKEVFHCLSLRSWRDKMLAESGDGRLRTLHENAKVLRIESRLLLSGRVSPTYPAFFNPADARLLEGHLISPRLKMAQPSKKSGVGNVGWSYSRYQRDGLVTLTVEVAPRAIKRMTELLAMLGDAEEEVPT